MGSQEVAGPARRRLTRRAVAAGSFYPADADVLTRTVDGLLAEAAARVAPVSGRPTAIVVPHAGYVYSGAVAASAYALVRGACALRGALLGPAHFVPVHGAAVPAADAWATPLGNVMIDAGLRAIAALAGAVVDDRPHEPEHALEVQLPFLVRSLEPGFAVLPVAVGPAPTNEVADLLEKIWDQADLVVVSTDLSHYLDDAAARRIDRRTVEAVLALDADAITDHAACGLYALRGIVELARRRELSVHLLDLRTSADATGERERVVGYGAFAIA